VRSAFEQEPELWKDFVTLVKCEISFFALFALYGYAFEVHRYPQAVVVVIFLALVWRGTTFYWYLAALAGMLVYFGWQHEWLLVALPPVLGLTGWWVRHLVRVTRSLSPAKEPAKTGAEVDPVERMPLAQVGMFGWPGRGRLG